jgi:uncharacterized membrane protein
VDKIMAHIQSFIADHQHTLKKTLSYYIMHITVAALVAFIVTGNLWMALTLSMIEPTVQAFAFFFHERAWNKIDEAN